MFLSIILFIHKILRQFVYFPCGMFSICGVIASTCLNSCGIWVIQFRCLNALIIFSRHVCLSEGICFRIILGACVNNHFYQCCKRIKNKNDSFSSYWKIVGYRVHLLALLWASVAEEFQDWSFFFIHLNWEGILRYGLKLE